MGSKRLHPIFAAFSALAFLACAAAPLAAQEAPPAVDLADLAQHKERWPAQLTLKEALALDIVLDGRKAGTMPAPAGSEVDLVAVSADGLTVRLASGEGKALPAQTDLAERLAASAPTAAAPAPAPTSAAPAPTAPTPAPAPVTPPASASLEPSPFQAEYEVPPGGNYTKAAFRFWCPAYPAEKPVRAVLVLVPGANGDGRGMAGDAAWQACARKHRAAIVACFMQGTDGGMAYHDATRGTGAVLLQVLEAFGKQAGRPEIGRAPIALWGHSAGGQFDYSFALFRPDRVLAFVVNKGGYYNRSAQPEAMRGIPALFFLGEKDEDYRVKAITEIWKEGRTRGALWALAPEPGAKHEPSWTAAASRTFFDEVLPMRLPDEGDDSGKPKPLQEADGWVGNLATHEIARADTPANRDAAWLPGEATATTWKKFVSGEKP